MRPLIQSALISFLLFLPCVAQADNYTTPGQFIGYKTLVTFWSGDCANCSRQLPVLINTAKMNPSVKFYIIQLQSTGQHTEIDVTLPSNLQQRYVAEADVTLRAFGATVSMLPFSAFMADDGTVCRSRAGVQGQSTLEDWIEKC